MASRLTTITVTDRRLSTRCILSDCTLVPAEFDNRNGGFVVNVSCCGAAVQLLSTLPSGTNRKLRISLPGEAPIETLSEVVWSTGHTTGVRFLNLDTQSRGRLERWVSAPAPETSSRPPAQDRSPVSTNPFPVLAQSAVTAGPAEVPPRPPALEIDSLLRRARNVAGADGVFLAMAHANTWTCVARVGAGPELATAPVELGSLCEQCIRTGDAVRHEGAVGFGCGAAMAIPLDVDRSDAALVCVWKDGRGPASSEPNFSVLSIVGQLISFVLGHGRANVRQPLHAAPAPMPLSNLQESSLPQAPAAPESSAATHPPKRIWHKVFASLLLIFSAGVLGWVAGVHWSQLSLSLYPTKTLDLQPLRPPATVPPVQATLSSPPEEPIVSAQAPASSTPTERAKPAVKNERPRASAPSPKKTLPQQKVQVAQIAGVTSYSNLNTTNGSQQQVGMSPSTTNDLANISVPLLIKKIAPQYPVHAKASGVRGRVVVNFTILADGRVGDVSVVSGKPILADAATEAVRQWRYKPAEANGKSVESTATAAFDFNLAAGD